MIEQEEYPSACAARIRELRKARKLNQREFGALIGVSINAVSDWESKGVVPKPQYLDSMSRLFNVSVDYILGTTTIPERAGAASKIVPRLQTVKAIDDLVQRLAVRNPDIMLLFAHDFSDAEFEVLASAFNAVVAMRDAIKQARATVPIANDPALGVAKRADSVG